MLNSKVVKCPGRFSQTREKVFEAAGIVLNSKAVSEQDLISIWDILQSGGDLFGLDGRDPYYDSPEDSARKIPPQNYLSLVPLFPRDYTLPSHIREQYAISMGNDPRIAQKLSRMSERGNDFYRAELGKDPADLYLDRGVTLLGYEIASNNGIGTLSEGGNKGGGLRSDAPYLLEIFKKGRLKREDTFDLAAIVGFWAQDDTMLVSQMQSCKNAQLPKEVSFGVTCVRTAERVAQELGFSKIELYTSRAHPIFLEHPENKESLAEQFALFWDGSARKLDYEGSRASGPTYNKRFVTSLR
ncbi:MAG: hypothetical protein Q8R18_05110 [bacterium]|nr:hypothetical protein [bacterium]